MAEENKTITYDFSKDIENLRVNTSFIMGLENLLMYFITELVEDPKTIPDTFRKFEEIIGGKEPELSPLEVHMYTIFALHQMFKYNAIDQKLHKEVEMKVSKEELKESLKLILEGDKESAFKKMAEIDQAMRSALS